jgi:hypothetical protein
VKQGPPAPTDLPISGSQIYQDTVSLKLKANQEVIVRSSTGVDAQLEEQVDPIWSCPPRRYLRQEIEQKHGENLELPEADLASRCLVHQSALI